MPGIGIGNVSGRFSPAAALGVTNQWAPPRYAFHNVLFREPNTLVLAATEGQDTASFATIYEFILVATDTPDSAQITLGFWQRKTIPTDIWTPELY